MYGEIIKHMHNGALIFVYKRIYIFNLYLKYGLECASLNPFVAFTNHIFLLSHAIVGIHKIYKKVIY